MEEINDSSKARERLLHRKIFYVEFSEFHLQRLARSAARTMSGKRDPCGPEAESRTGEAHAQIESSSK